MKKQFLLAIAVATCTGLAAQDFDYQPGQVGNHQIITYTQFTLSYNEEHEQADWVAYELTAGEVSAEMDRCDCFATDHNVTSGSSTEKDYGSTGFDKGHLCPAADNNMSEEANQESFLMSNMSPQLPQFNRGIWADLEHWVRQQAKEHKKIYVVTGPVFVNNLGTMSDKKITIPGYFYKTILRFDGKTVKTIAFLLPHVGAVGKLKDYVVAVNSVETLTGIDFYPVLNNSVENKAESQIELKTWGF
ncbi:MAG: DNA/RNA non-specific endonuclease [Flavobacteriales bacterium]|nr:DNA/RNA non-specific endonuclease [Flavobacteriales bacterium]